MILFIISIIISILAIARMQAQLFTDFSRNVGVGFSIVLFIPIINVCAFFVGLTLYQSFTDPFLKFTKN